MVDHESPLPRDRLVTTLVERFDLPAVAAEACRRAGTPDRADAVAYCLVVLTDKPDPARSSAGEPAKRTYELDMEADDFAERLRAWAQTIAANLRDAAGDYEAIHDEFDRYEIATLRSLVRLRTADDVIVAIADKLVAVLTGGQRLEDMTLELALESEPFGAEYVFQTPLRQWIATSAKRMVAPDTDPLDVHEETIIGRTEHDERSEYEREIDVRGELDLDVYRELVDRVARLADTKNLLPDVIERVERGLDRDAARSRLASGPDTTLFARVRAELTHVCDELRTEQRAFGAMLAYIVLAMRSAPGLQGVTILSLRLAWLERAVIDHIAARMRAVIGDPRQPTPVLIGQTRSAAKDRGVSARRVRALEGLGQAPDDRGRELRPVVALLAALPATVDDVAAIGAALPKPMAASTVTTTRGDAVTELTAVDVWFGRAFRRYAMARA